MTNPPTQQDLEASIVDFGWHMGLSLCLALMGPRHPADSALNRTRRIGFQFAASDAKRRGTYPLFQQGAKAATKAMIHSNKNQ